MQRNPTMVVTDASTVGLNTIAGPLQRRAALLRSCSFGFGHESGVPGENVDVSYN